MATTLFEVLQKAKHKIKTGYGISAPVYSDKETAISGIGQGNWLGPALWALISSIIFKMCKAQGHRMNMTIPISKHEISFMGFAFVDDADLIASAEDVNTSGATMIARFQAMMTCWDYGIRATGELPLRKQDGSYYHFSGMVWIGNTIQKNLFQGTFFFLIKMVTYTQ